METDFGIYFGEAKKLEQVININTRVQYLSQRFTLVCCHQTFYILQIYNMTFLDIGPKTEKIKTVWNEAFQLIGAKLRLKDRADKCGPLLFPLKMEVFSVLAN